jgi:hypothetical protein
MLADGVAQVDAYYSSDFYKNIAILLATNDLVDHTAEQHYDNIETWCVARKAAGFLVAALTLPPRGATAEWENLRNDVNTRLRNDHSFADVLIDFGADPEMGLQDNCSSYIYYYDSIHPSTLGFDIMARCVLDGIRTL